MIYSGLDWSGSPGEAHGEVVVFAAAHFTTDALGALTGALAAARAELGVPPDYVFKNNGTTSRTRTAFFRALAPLDFTAHIHILNKRHWAAMQTGKTTGPQCIRDGIVTLIKGCPNEVVAGQVLFVDAEPSQRAEIRHFKTEIRQALRDVRPRRFGFSDVRGCEDHRIQGAIIQVADLLAGQVSDHGDIAGPHLPTLGGKVKLV